MKTGFRRIHLIWAAVLGIALICISFSAAKTGLLTGEKEKIVMPLSIESTSFMHDHEIPARHTCDGLDISPPLAWTGVPGAAKSLVLIVFDPDAPYPPHPKTTWVHWVMYNISPDANSLKEGVSAKDNPHGALQGMNDWHSPGYGGPCPPVSKHRYFFKLYALDTVLPDMKYPTKAVLEKAMQKHILAKSELVGLYQRP
jgi:Raf kinase inhibitor-like YbhB/YbcL family protein